MSTASATPLLHIENLGVSFRGHGRDMAAVSAASLTVDRGETVALVGESGSGKSVTALSVLQLLPYPHASHPHGSIRFRGQELIDAPKSLLHDIRGDRISMIFQEPMTSLNPLHTVEKQITETLTLHKGLTGSQARDRCLELLDLVRIDDAETRLKSWPHQLSGGQRQRIMIAMALANEPELLIADEPTTALDVTVQARILELLRDLQRDLGDGDSADHPRPHHRAQRGGPGLRDDRRRNRRERRDRGGLRSTEALRHPEAARRGAGRPAAAGRPRRGRNHAHRRPSGLVSHPARAAAAYRRSRQGGRRGLGQRASGSDGRCGR